MLGRSRSTTAAFDPEVIAHAWCSSSRAFYVDHEASRLQDYQPVPVLEGLASSLRDHEIEPSAEHKYGHACRP